MDAILPLLRYHSPMASYLPNLQYVLVNTKLHTLLTLWHFHQHNLPKLRNFDDVAALTVLQSTCYWHHYYAGNLPAEPDRLIMIRRAIGCTAQE
jgi:hypothetical protein